MSLDPLAELLANRQKFTAFLEEELSQTESTINTTSKHIDLLDTTKSNISELAKKVEHQALIPLGKKIYVEGVITHPGEYFIDHVAHPDSFTTLETAQDTLKYLQRRSDREMEVKKICEGQRTQLSERISMISGGSEEKIVSDRGVAFKVGDYYEILEYEDLT